jgi:UDP-2,3-diacylglucosamine pyrophosphatase LpxH
LSGAKWLSRNVEVAEAPDHTAGEERAIVAEIAVDAPAHVLVASDLHLHTGRDPVTGAYRATENFLADDTFAAWLADADAADTLLILNGDVFDFIRIMDAPATAEHYERWSQVLARLGRSDTPEALRRSVSREEKRFGLRTDDYKTVWKLLLIAGGHRPFFGALADFLGGGGSLLLVKGNHDVELHWPLVRRAIRTHLVDRGAPLEAVSERVGFADAGVTIRNLYVEHGHEYERMTGVGGPAVLPRDQTQINLPFGSLVNRYFINVIEPLDPFIDNIKPVQRALLALIRRHPIAVFAAYFRSWPHLVAAVARRPPSAATIPIALALVAPLLLVAAVVAFAIWRPAASAAGWLLSGGVLVLLLVLPYLAGLFGDVVRRLFRKREPDHLLDGACAKAKSVFAGDDWPRVYVSMGHSHVARAERMDDAGRGLYLNTGTWVGLWPEDRPDLLGRTVYTYMAFHAVPGGGYRHEALEWNQHAAAPRPACFTSARRSPIAIEDTSEQAQEVPL